jgi:hypothetical protein
MELWQLELVGRFHLADGTALVALTGIDTILGSVCALGCCSGHSRAGGGRFGGGVGRPRRGRSDPDR